MGLHSVTLFALMLVLTDQTAYGTSESVLNKVETIGVNLLMECAKEMEVTKEMVDDIIEKGSLIDYPCVIACMNKKCGMMDDAGMYSLEGTQKLIKQIAEGESPEDTKELEDSALNCVSVNDEPVKDGAKGCERALLIHKCFNE